LPWCFGDEATSQSEDLLLRAEAQEKIYVPSHWPAEILNGLTKAVRRGRIAGSAVADFLDVLPDFNISVDERSMSTQWSAAMPLIERYGLSGYDAIYLALALHLNIPLATFDERLREAARLEHVELAL
jgi:predicted nucleic acid-binding protein